MISVLLPAYNEEEFIAEAVQSILDQSHIDFELIIINDGSTDNTPKILESFNDNRIIIINNEKNYGLSKSLNIGVAKSNGEFIARMDANDIAYPSRFVEQYNFFSNHPKAVAVFCPVEKINKDGVSLNRVEGKYIPSEELQAYLFYKCCFFHSSVLMRKEFLPIPLYNESNAAEDYELWVRLASKYELHILKNVLMKVRDLPGGLRFKNKCRTDYLQTKVNNLRFLKIYPTEDEKNIHEGLEKKTIISNLQAIEKIKWLDKLYLSNKKYFVYQEPYFTNRLLEHWNGVVNNINKSNIKFIITYFRSPLKKKAKKPLFRTIKVLFPLFYL